MFIESICIRNRIVQNIEYHNYRCNKVRKKEYKSTKELFLENYIDLANIHTSGRIKCRIIYGEDIHLVEYHQYVLPEISSLKIIECSDVEYKYKSVNREKLEALFTSRENSDDILISKNGLLTDSSYCNIALCKNQQYYTPRNPLLKGTKRGQLIDEKVVSEKQLFTKNIYDYDFIILFNAMIEFGEVKISTENVTF